MTKLFILELIWIKCSVSQFSVNSSMVHIEKLSLCKQKIFFYYDIFYFHNKRNDNETLQKRNEVQIIN